MYLNDVEIGAIILLGFFVWVFSMLVITYIENSKNNDLNNYYRRSNDIENGYARDRGQRKILSNDGFIGLDNDYSYFRDSPRVDCCSHSSSSDSYSSSSSD